MLDPGTFGGTPACHILVEVFNKIDDQKMSSRFCKLYQIYHMGIEDILQIPSKPTRHIVLKMWFEKYRKIFEENFADFFAEHGEAVSLIYNVIGTTWKRGIRDGDVLQRLRGGH